MNAAPGRVPGTDLQHHQIKRAETLPDARKLAGQTRISREKQAPAFAADDPGRPERTIAIGEAAPAEVLRGRRREGQLAARQRVLLPPVELRDQSGRDAERFEPGADPERG